MVLAGSVHGFLGVGRWSVSDVGGWRVARRTSCLIEHKQNEISRRDFATRARRHGCRGPRRAAICSARPASASPAPAFSSRVLGANDRVVLASIGVRGQGNALKRGFARLQNVEIKTICDIDANLADERINDPKLDRRRDVQARLRAGPAPRARRQGHRRRHHRHAEPLARAGHDLGAAGRQARLRREARLAHRVGRPQDGRGGRASTTASSRSAR